ncbi:MAG TPA: DUF4157 domain-containing protein [Longimicrobium sp.]|nr:DUF4157 domain-containing protein [Longimicrobium sp.]
MSELLRVRRPHARVEGAHAPAARARAPAGAAPAPARYTAPAWAAVPPPAVVLLGGVQRKPVIGQQGDAYEREADAVADRVAGGLSAPAAGVSLLGPAGPAGPPQLKVKEKEDLPVHQMMEVEEHPTAPPPNAVQAASADPPPDDDEGPIQLKEEDEDASASIQLKEDEDDDASASIQLKEEDEEAPIQLKEDDDDASAPIQLKEEEDEDPVQRLAPAGAAPTAAMQNTAASAIASPGTGSGLPATTRGTLETRMGVDLGGVRVHDGPGAHWAAAGLRARAFTHGRHIWLARGESAGDVRLMAHEVTHVLQQDGAVRRKPAEKPKKEAPAGEPKPKTPPPAAGAPPATPSPASAAGSGPAPAAAGAGPVEPLMPEAPAELSPTEQARLATVDQRAGGAVEATTDLPPAEAQVGDARAAVEEPAEETQARAGDQLVEALGERPAPSPEIEELCEHIYQVIRDKRPPDEDSLVEADPQEMAREAGGEMNASVEGDTQNVQGQYDQLQEQPAGAPATEPQPLEPPPAGAPPPDLAAGAAAPEGVPPEAVSLDADVAASEQRMADAGMDSEPARLVQDGPIAEARAAQGELAETAARDPQEVLAEQQATLAGAQGDMAALQARALEALQGGRERTTTEGASQQQGMVGSEEEMRTRAAAEAQRIFDDAQARVGELLEPLPRTAMARWEAGVAVLSTEFDQHLARVKAWVDERHESTALAVLDYFTGLPDWVTEEYDDAERTFGDGVCDLIREISRDVNGVIAACEAIVDDSRERIAAVFAALPTELQGWAAEQQADFGNRLNGLQERAQQTRSDFTRDLTRAASQAVQDVRVRVHELRQAAGGLLGRIADAVNAFLDDPARFIINGLLSLLGISPAAFWAVVDKIGAAIDSIADDPMNFVNNLMAALGQGFTQFFDNIGDHLLQGLLDWLFSGLGSVGVQIPADTSIGSIVTFFLQLMGLTWANIRQILARHIGEENVALIEKAWELVSSLIEMGPEGLFELIKEQLDPANLLQMVLDAAVDYLVEALISAVTPRILLMFNPAGAIIQAIEAIFRVLKWIFENAARIFSLVETVVNGITDLIAGNIGGMANAVEGALARLIPPVIDFLAGYLGLGGLPEAIADVIRGFQTQVLAVVDRVIGFLADRARALLRALTGAPPEAEAEATGEPQAAGPDGQPTVTLPFSMEGAGHTITLHPAESGGLDVTMASGQSLPLASKFAAAHTKLDNLRRFIATIQDPDVKQLFEEEFGSSLEDLPGDLVARFTAVYEEFFPRGTPRRELTEPERQRAQQRVAPLIQEAQALTAKIAKFGDDLDIRDLSGDAIDTAVQTEGNRLWSRAWQQKKTRIEGIIRGHSFRGAPLAMRGSAQKGFRGDPKARTRFDERDFDIDLYVVHPQAYDDAIEAGARNVRGMIFPQAAVPDLQAAEDAVVGDLATAFPEVTRVATSDLVLRATRPTG